MLPRLLALGALATGLTATDASAAVAPPADTPPPPTASDDDHEGPPAARGGGRTRAQPPPAGTTTAPPRPGGAAPPPPSGAPGTTPTTPTEPEGPPVDLSENWGYSKSRPVSPLYVRGANSGSQSAAPNPVGFYSGVSTQGNHVPPRPPDKFDTRPATMTWTGFERAPEGSRVFFEVNGPIRHTMSKKGLTITIKMTNTKVNVRNNRRHLDLRYFQTPVQMVRVRKRGKDTEATIQLKRDASPALSLQQGKGGYQLLTLQFDDARPAGSSSSTDPYRTAGGGGYVGDDPSTYAPADPNAGTTTGGATTDSGATTAGATTDATAANGTALPPPPPPAPGTQDASTDAAMTTGELDLFIVNWD